MINSLFKKNKGQIGFTSFSQDGEDMIMRSFYEENPSYKGFYVDIGALDPFRFSNTCFFYNAGWRGINIEPTPSAIALFKKHRPNDINLNIAIGEKAEQLIFYCFNEPALNSFSKDLANEREGKEEYFVTNKLPIAVYPLHQILSQYVPKDQKIDFMSIDVEGLDLSVLKSNDWEKFRPQYLLVEDIFEYLDELGKSEICNFLSQKSYKPVAKTSRTLIFKDVLNF